MKNIIYIILFLPFISFAVELHPESDCEQLKADLSDVVSDIAGQVNYWEYNISGATNSYVKINNAVYDFRQKSRYSAYSDEVKEAYHYCAYNSDLQQGLSSVGLLINDMQIALGFEQSALLSSSNLVSSIDCSQCPVGGTNCCDFSSIISAINDVQSAVQSNGRDISQILQVLNRWLPQIDQYIEYININVQNGFIGVTNTMFFVNDCVTNMIYSLDQSIDGGFLGVTNILNRLLSLQSGSNLALSRGFGNVTNLLSSIYEVDLTGWGVATNYLDMMYMPEYADDWLWQTPEMLTQLRYPSYINGQFNRFYGDKSYFNNDKWQYGAWLYGLTPTFYLMMQEMMGSFYAQNSWTQYQHDFMYPPITNSLIQIHADTTNFFSFFRGEIGMQGVLTDWTPQYGSYYDFLTNHYLAIMRGETLSANMSTKTNWFSRIETLLAALVFPDSPSTNVVDSSAYSEQQQAINSAISSVNSSASQSFRDFENSANSVVSLYQMFAQNFDNVALPSRIVLFTLTNEDNSSEVIEFGFSDNPALTAFVEGCRAVSTFCWASVGIFLLFKFMVWALRGIYLTILFVYKVISAVLH